VGSELGGRQAAVISLHPSSEDVAASRYGPGPGSGTGSRGKGSEGTPGREEL